jgi:hypothetical protein
MDFEIDHERAAFEAGRRERKRAETRVQLARSALNGMLSNADVTRRAHENVAKRAAGLTHEQVNNEVLRIIARKAAVAADALLAELDAAPRLSPEEEALARGMGAAMDAVDAVLKEGVPGERSSPAGAGPFDVTSPANPELALGALSGKQRGRSLDVEG